MLWFFSVADHPVALVHRGRRYAVVRRSDVSERMGEEAAWRLVRRGLEEGGARFQRELVELAEQLGSRMVLGARKAAEVVVDALISGRLVVVSWRDSSRLMSEPSEITDLRSLGGKDVVLPLRPLDGPDPPLQPHDPIRHEPEPSTTINIEVVHETGGWFAGTGFTVELPDGQKIDAVLDDRSRWTFDGISGSGACSVRFHDRLALSDEEWRAPSCPPCEISGEDISTFVGHTGELSVPIGRLSRIVVRLPPKVPLVSLGAGLFIDDHAFVTASIGPALDAVAEALREDPRRRVSAVANGDLGQDAAQAKRISDARAKALVAVLTNDRTAFDELAEQESWSLRHYQAMLRALGCNPAAIDDVDGPLTQRAIRWFQAEWSRGVHDPDGLAAPLEVTGSLDHGTKAAIRRAYLLALSPQLSVEQLAPSSAIGCGAFTQAPAGGGGHLRGGLALWPTHLHPTDVPCREGDADACVIDGRGAHDQCRYHRETFVLDSIDVAPVFYDFSWLRLPTGSFNLSVVTSLPDKARVRFHVFRDVIDYDGRVLHHHGSQPLPARGLASGTVDGIVRYGIAVALWTPPAEWDVLDWRRWFVELDRGEDAPTPTAPYFRPPLFAIEYDGGWAFSRPPGERIDRFALSNGERPGLALDNNGHFVAFSASESLVITSPRERRADEQVQIVGWCSYEHHLVQEGSP